MSHAFSQDDTRDCFREVIVRQGHSVSVMMKAPVLKTLQTLCITRTGCSFRLFAYPLESELVRCLQSMDSWMSENIEKYLVPSANSWQPSDFLPDPSSAEFMDAIQELRKECKNLPPEYLVVLVGDMVTEEALPSYMSMLNRMDGSKDHTGESSS